MIGEELTGDQMKLFTITVLQNLVNNAILKMVDKLNFIVDDT